MIHVYLHAARMNHYREIVDELLDAMDASGLNDEAESINVNESDPSEYEYPTLRLLHEHAKKSPSDFYLYLHTKGAARVGQHRDAWRKYLTYVVIENWQTCVMLLSDGYDAVGNDITLNTNSNAYHFCGNFWWARGDHLARLADPYEMKTRDPKGERYGAEIWVGSNGGRMGEVMRCDASRYLHRRNPIPETAYRGLPVGITEGSLS